VRLADVPADAGTGHGIFEELHGYASGAEFADALAERAKRLHGTAAREYVEALLGSSSTELRAAVEKLRADFIQEALPPGATGQARRVGARFGLIAAAGEIATRLGLTGWPEGESIRAATGCFQGWLDRRGGAGYQEEREALAQVRLFLELHGESRFSKLDEDHTRTLYRAGFRRFVDGTTQYLILPEVFRNEICKGFDHRDVARGLKARGLLVTNEEDRLQLKVPKVGRVYAVKGDFDAM
jgi:uncharacterized protein (DUF927 family)